MADERHHGEAGHEHGRAETRACELIAGLRGEHMALLPLKLRHAQVPRIFLRIHPAARKHAHALLHKRRRNVVLRRERVAAGCRHLRAAVPQNGCEVCGFRLEMYRHCYFKPLKRALAFEPEAQALEHRHIRAHPVNFPSA